MGEAGGGQVPDPAGAVGEHDQLPDVLAAALAGVRGEQAGVVIDKLQGGDVAGRGGIADWVPPVVGGGLGEARGKVRLADVRAPVRALAGPVGGFGGGHRDTGAIHGEVERAGAHGGRRRDDLPSQDRGVAGVEFGCGGSLGGALHALNRQG